MAMRTLWRLAALLALCALALQVYFLLRIAAMTVLDPHSSSFQRSEAFRLATGRTGWHWQQEWRPLSRLSPQLARAVVASEDAGFAAHKGVEWQALERAWTVNQRQAVREQRLAARRGGEPASTRMQGGSTISQQLAKNLFLSGERRLARKAQELVITLMLETVLSKQRILEIYLNSVEWGEGVFGAEAAARRYFHVSASQLDSAQASRLAVMLPAPKRFEKRPESAWVSHRAASISARMGGVALP